MFERLTMAALLLLSLIIFESSTGLAEPVHSSQLPPLTLDGPFPRCSEDVLTTVGFPDHMHSQWWPGWQVLQDESGQTYGPGAFCSRKTLLNHEGLQVEPGRNSIGHFVTLQNEAYKACDLMIMLECLDWAGHVLPEMLGLELTDTLTVTSPDNIPAYTQQTGQGIWRLYQLSGNEATIETFGTLVSRTLETHAVFMLVTDWLLHENMPVPLPAWMHAGLVEYMGEDGAHLVNYMKEFRNNGDILFSPAISNLILNQPVDPDQGRDREMFRRASYSAFLMVWELVENRGGMKTMRDFLVLACEGVELDRASQKVYGMTMDELATSLDPVVLGEPIGDNIQATKPSKQPTVEN